MIVMDSAPQPVANQSPAPPAATDPKPATIADIFTPRIQASLFVLLLGLLGFIAWNSFRPTRSFSSDDDSPPRIAKVDLNRAERGDLMMLPSIGPQLAERILEYRIAHGPFEGIADLRKIPGIGPTTIEKLRPHVQLSWPDRPVPKSESPALVVLPAKLTAKAAKAPSEPLNLNRASLDELQKLPRIGPKLAQRIIDARQQKPFASISEVRRVPGIGPKTLEGIKPYVAVADAPSASHLD
jgi:competence ComEA-like helix-hairpin-helix protein